MKLPWDQIEELTKYLKKKGLAEISIQTKEGSISLKKDSPTIVTAPSAPMVSEHIKTEDSKKTSSPEKSSLHEIKSPMVGTFYMSPSPGAEAFVKVGSKVNKGDVLCIIEAMKIMNEMPADTNGVIKEILANDGEVIEFGQVLFRIEP